MGLTTWKNSPDGRVLKSDVTIAKNYLDEIQIKRLERTVGAFFDYIKCLIEDPNTFTMKEFSESVNAFHFNDTIFSKTTVKFQNVRLMINLKKNMIYSIKHKRLIQILTRKFEKC